jgi:hypothetical protein
MSSKGLRKLRLRAMFWPPDCVGRGETEKKTNKQGLTNQDVGSAQARLLDELVGLLKVGSQSLGGIVIYVYAQIPAPNTEAGTASPPSTQGVAEGHGSKHRSGWLVALLCTPPTHRHIPIQPQPAPWIATTKIVYEQ